jgi:hypothetical protein
MARSGGEAAEADGFRWRSHPVRTRGWRGGAAAGAVVAIAAGVGALTGSWFWAILSGVMLFLSLEGFFLPTTYELGPSGVRVRRVFSRSERPWESVRRVYDDRRGLTLSPYRRRTALEPYRAIRLLFDGADPQEVRREVRGRLDPEVEWIDLTVRKGRG